MYVYFVRKKAKLKNDGKRGCGRIDKRVCQAYTDVKEELTLYNFSLNIVITVISKISLIKMITIKYWLMCTS